MMLLPGCYGIVTNRCRKPSRSDSLKMEEFVQTQESRKVGSAVRRPWLLTILTAVAIDLVMLILGYEKVYLGPVHFQPSFVVFLVLVLDSLEWVSRWLGDWVAYGLYFIFFWAVFFRPLVFLLWQPRLLRGESRLPVRNRLLLSIGAVLSALYYASHWRQGLQHEGLSSVVFCAAFNAVLLALAVRSILRAHRRPSFSANLLAQGLLFLWLLTFAFPVLGDPGKMTLCGDWCGHSSVSASDR